MMLWVGIALVLIGFPLLAIDRRAAFYFREKLPAAVKHFAYKTTDYAKGGPWIAVVALLYLAAQIWLAVAGENPAAHAVSTYSLALLASFVLGSVVLHSVKIFLGRRRPRDDFEHGLYGFVFFTWSLQYNSFPSGHALTIFCVAIWATAIFPAGAPLWFALALYFGLTRAMLTAHFLSDVLIGAGIGVLATRETLVLLFPQLTPAWF